MFKRRMVEKKGGHIVSRLLFPLDQSASWSIPLWTFITLTILLLTIILSTISVLDDSILYLILRQISQPLSSQSFIFSTCLLLTIFPRPFSSSLFSSQPFTSRPISFRQLPFLSFSSSHFSVDHLPTYLSL